MLIAEFTNGSKTREPSLMVSDLENGRKERIFSRAVEGKREARKIAEQFGAKAWNF